jgi:hypothetical protein
MDLARLALGWGLVWLLGAGALRRAYARPVHAGAMVPLDPRVHPAWMAGAGLVLGCLLLVLEMVLVSRLGLAFGVASIGVPLVVAVIALWLPDLRSLRSARRTVDPPASGHRAIRGPVAWAYGLLLAWLVVHALLLLGEVLQRPLYAWDAWTQWATKAKVWFALRHMVPFLDAGTWLAGGTPGYFDAAPHYPAMVPLWQVWSSVVLGRYDDTLMNLPWWLLAVALALALYGFLRQRGFAPLAALVGTWLIVSMPILEAHVALAGYADLPLATFLTCAVLAGLMALDTRSRVHASVALVLALALPMIKNPGWAWLATLVPGIVVGLLPARGMRIAAAGWALAVLAALALSRFDANILNYHLHLQLQVPWHGLVEAYLSFGNWHLLFWLLPAVLLVAHASLDARGIAPLTAVIVSGVLFLLLGFSLTNAFAWVEDQSTVNRATLHLAPLIGVWMLLLMQRALAPAALAGAEIRARTADPLASPLEAAASGEARGETAGASTARADIAGASARPLASAPGEA